MAKAKFLRLGSIHRNTFICAPEVLQPTLQLKSSDNLFIAGQLSGVEGYVESIAMGLLGGINAANMGRNLKLTVPPPHTAFGALISHLTATEPAIFQPSNVNFGLFPAWKSKVPKKQRGERRAHLAKEALQQWMRELL